ncbi:Centrosomal protein of 19 kDa [Blyttiomyces sp. JEL0837]|nr:Centrosomal protein of 19 kDa [Blyttiomyces sp. JEL0837]
MRRRSPGVLASDNDASDLDNDDDLFLHELDSALYGKHTSASLKSSANSDIQPNKIGIRFNKPTIILFYTDKRTGHYRRRKIPVRDLVKSDDENKVYPSTTTIVDNLMKHHAVLSSITRETIERMYSKIRIKNNIPATTTTMATVELAKPKSGSSWLNDLPPLPAKGLSSPNELKPLERPKMDSSSTPTPAPIAKIDLNANLNKLDDKNLNEIKKFMDKDFEKNRVKPGDPGFQYDLQKEFEKPTEDNEWDESDSESPEPASSIPKAQNDIKAPNLTSSFSSTTATKTTLAPISSKPSTTPLPSTPPTTKNKAAKPAFGDLESDDEIHEEIEEQLQDDKIHHAALDSASASLGLGAHKRISSGEEDEESATAPAAFWWMKKDAAKEIEKTHEAVSSPVQLPRQVDAKSKSLEGLLGNGKGDVKESESKNSTETDPLDDSNASLPDELKRRELPKMIPRKMSYSDELQDGIGDLQQREYHDSPPQERRHRRVSVSSREQTTIYADSNESMTDEKPKDLIPVSNAPPGLGTVKTTAKAPPASTATTTATTTGPAGGKAISGLPLPVGNSNTAISKSNELATPQRRKSFDIEGGDSNTRRRKSIDQVLEPAAENHPSIVLSSESQESFGDGSGDVDEHDHYEYESKDSSESLHGLSSFASAPSILLTGSTPFTKTTGLRSLDPIIGSSGNSAVELDVGRNPSPTITTTSLTPVPHSTTPGASESKSSAQSLTATSIDSKIPILGSAATNIMSIPTSQISNDKVNENNDDILKVSLQTPQVAHHPNTAPISNGKKPTTTPTTAETVLTVLDADQLPSEKVLPPFKPPPIANASLLSREPSPAMSPSLVSTTMKTPAPAPASPAMPAPTVAATNVNADDDDNVEIEEDLDFDIDNMDDDDDFFSKPIPKPTTSSITRSLGDSLTEKKETEIDKSGKSIVGENSTISKESNSAILSSFLKKTEPTTPEKKELNTTITSSFADPFSKTTTTTINTTTTTTNPTLSSLSSIKDLPPLGSSKLPEKKVFLSELPPLGGKSIMSSSLTTSSTTDASSSLFSNTKPTKLVNEDKYDEDDDFSIDLDNESVPSLPLSDDETNDKRKTGDKPPSSAVKMSGMLFAKENESTSITPPPVTVVNATNTNNNTNSTTIPSKISDSPLFTKSGNTSTLGSISTTTTTAITATGTTIKPIEDRPHPITGGFMSISSDKPSQSPSTTIKDTKIQDFEYSDDFGAGETDSEPDSEGGSGGGGNFTKSTTSATRTGTAFIRAPSVTFEIDGDDDIEEEIVFSDDDGDGGGDGGLGGDDEDDAF